MIIGLFVVLLEFMRGLKLRVKRKLKKVDFDSDEEWILYKLIRGMLVKNLM